LKNAGQELQLYAVPGDNDASLLVYKTTGLINKQRRLIAVCIIA